MNANSCCLKKLSFVVTSRNDGITGSELNRTQIFVDSLLEQCSRFKLDAELIVVEWNPPEHKPLLADALTWTKSSVFCPVRIIQVPGFIHNRFQNSDEIPLFQMIAKNVGIRRAYGRFILATNIDIIFSNELMQFLASANLNPNRMYRIDRYDVHADIPAQMRLDERLDWCYQHLLRIYRSDAIVQVQSGQIPLLKPALIPSTLLTRLKSWWNMQFPLHTNACGDFTMLSADYWRKLRGYAEIPVRAMKLDALLCYAAHYAGASQILLEEPMRIYHIDHLARSDGALHALSRRETDSQTLQLSSDTYRSYVKRIQRSFRPILFNDINWGLAKEDLPETIIGSTPGRENSSDPLELMTHDR
jgi:hypothetical protein